MYISELPRTCQTAEIINKYHDKELVNDALLNDNSTGFKSKHVQDWIDVLDSSENRWVARFNDGESLNDAAKRGRELIDFLKHQPYESILVVTHGFMTQAIFGYLENKSLEEASEFNFIQVTYAEFKI